MQSKRSSKNQIVSRPYITECLRRYWPISLVATIVLFLVSVFVEIISHEAGEAADTISSTLIFNNETVIVVLALLTLITGTVLSRYQHHTADANIAYALPVTRGGLYVSTFLSGMILTLIPFFAVALMMLPYVELNFNASGLAFDPEYGFLAIAHANLRTLAFFCIVIVILALFLYAFTALAGSVTGNAPIQVVTTIFFNIVSPLVLAIVLSYLNRFLLGFWETDAMYAISKWLHPFQALDGAERLIDYAYLLIYIPIALAIAALGYLFAVKRKVERAGDSILYRSLEYVVVMIMTFFGMSAGAFLFGSIDAGTSIFGHDEMNRIPFYIGAAIGAALTLVFITMAFKKTLKVFNLNLLKRLGIFAVIAAIFLLVTTFDITGFEKRVPQAPSVRSATVQMNVPDVFGTGYRNDLETTIPVTDPDDILLVTNLHRTILDYYEKDGVDPSLRQSGGVKHPYSEILSIKYNGLGFSKIARRYQLWNIPNSTDYVEGLSLQGPAFSAFLCSKSFREISTARKQLGGKPIQAAYIASEYTDPWDTYPENSNDLLDLSKEELEALLDCIDRDYLTLPLNEILDHYNDVFYLDLKPIATYNNVGYRVAVTSGYAETIAFLKEKGLYRQITARYWELKKQNGGY